MFGNAILTFVANGNTIAIITIREILIASLGLLFLPKSFNINISDIIGDKKLLPVTGGRLEENKETIAKLNSVSETIEEMAKSYNEVAESVLDEQEDIKEKRKKLFHEELLNNLEEHESNVLYDDIIDEDELVVSEVYELLEKR